MTKGDAGQNISKFAQSSTEASQISTSLPFISYVDLAYWLNVIYQHSLSAVAAYFSATSNVSARSIAKFKHWCDKSSAFSDVFVCDGYRLCRAAKLLMSLGYGNFSTVIQYDIYAMAEKFLSGSSSWDASQFTAIVRIDPYPICFQERIQLRESSAAMVKLN